MPMLEKQNTPRNSPYVFKQQEILLDFFMIGA
jgi:hypothetical protein